MLLFTDRNMAYATVICILFGVCVGSFTWISRTENVCSQYFGNSTGLCYFALGGISTGIAGIAWPFLPTPARTIVSIASTMPTRSVFQFQLAVLTYVEMIPVFEHLFMKLPYVPIEVGECFKEETVYSFQLVKRALFKESHVEQMNAGIKDVVSSFNGVKTYQERFRDEVEKMMEWLDSRGMTCKDALRYPYKQCEKTFYDWERRCWDPIAWRWKSAECAFESIKYKTEWGFCQILKPISDTACQIFSNRKVSEFLVQIRTKIENWISSAIRIRVGVRFELTTTNYVAQEMHSAWSPVIQMLRAGSRASSWVYSFVKEVFLKNMGFLLLVCYPVYYLLSYIFGPLTFDNKYIPVEEEYRQYVRMKATDPDEVRFLPLVCGPETDKLQMVPQWLPMPREAGKLIKSLVWTADLLVLFLLMVIDYYLTSAGDSLYRGTIHAFNKYQGVIFEVTHVQNATGFQRFGAFMADQLDQLQHAVGLGRMVACARRPPPITYGYSIFALCFFWRLVWLYSSAKLAWLPSMMCARYYRHRHRQRLRALKARTLLARKGCESPHMFPWLRACFRAMCNCELCVCVDETFEMCGVDLKHTFNL